MHSNTGAAASCLSSHSLSHNWSHSNGTRRVVRQSHHSHFRVSLCLWNEWRWYSNRGIVNWDLKSSSSGRGQHWYFTDCHQCIMTMVCILCITKRNWRNVIQFYCSWTRSFLIFEVLTRTKWDKEVRSIESALRIPKAIAGDEAKISMALQCIPFYWMQL